MVDTPADRLRRAREKKGFDTAAEAARCYGWTISTYVSHENGTRGITNDAAKRYARAFNVGAETLVDLGVSGPTNEVHVMGEAAFGVWREKSIDLERRENKMLLSLPKTAGEQMRFAVEVLDSSVNKILMRGDYAICTPPPDSDLEPRTLVYVQHTRGDLVERTIRIVHEHKGSLELRTHSTDPNYTSSIEYPPKYPGSAVKILGLVVGSYSPITLVSP